MKRIALILALWVTLVLSSQASVAHELGGGAPVPGWSFEPALIAPLLIAAAIFVAGWWRLRARAARGRRSLDRRAALFAAGWLVLAGAVVSPLHQLGTRSFAAHMFEHELLMLAAAPLLVLAHPLAIMLWAFPARTRLGLGSLAGSSAITRAWQVGGSPLFATLLQAAVLWLWHAPALFDRALASETWHIAQHLSFLVAALLFWTAMLARTTPRSVAIVALFATSLVTGALGALMTFAASPWYARYAALGLAPFGLTPTQDQQLAGLLMWVPGGLVHAGAALVLLHALLGPDDRNAYAG